MFINQNRPFYCYRLGCVSTQKKCSSVTEILPMFWREPVLLAPAHCWDISPFLQQQTTSNSTCLPYKVCIAFTTWKWYHKHWAGLSSHESTSIMTSHQYRNVVFFVLLSWKKKLRCIMNKPFLRIFSDFVQTDESKKMSEFLCRPQLFTSLLLQEDWAAVISISEVISNLPKGYGDNP